MKTFYLKKAIPAVMVGIAFFFAGCQPKVPVSVKMEGWETASNMRVTAEEYLETERYEKALALLKRIAREYPDYDEIPLVEYQIARSYYLLGEYEISSDDSVRWLEKYPRHSARAEVMLLLGEAFEALGNRPQAFYWYLEAKRQ
ncbi:MAG: outer membrane protein assembly factor BamD, partial [Deltaproteobacteria bacterium]|nr:outer membrane protein assembly factor BamD [Deltaproteobacteria bacterium]